jgi:hypothetical protein
MESNKGDQQKKRPGVQAPVTSKQTKLSAPKVSPGQSTYHGWNRNSVYSNPYYPNHGYYHSGYYYAHPANVYPFSSWNTYPLHPLMNFSPPHLPMICPHYAPMANPAICQYPPTGTNLHGEHVLPSKPVTKIASALENDTLSTKKSAAKAIAKPATKLELYVMDNSCKECYREKETFAELCSLLEDVVGFT